MAGSVQTLRNSASKRISADLSPHAVSFSRFVFALPIVAIYVLFLLYYQQIGRVENISFWFFVLGAALLQIVGNSLLVMLFHYKNFATAVTLSRTDTVLGALIGAIWYQQPLNIIAICAILLSAIGVISISVFKHATFTTFCKSLSQQPATAIGLASGFCFSLPLFFALDAHQVMRGGTKLGNAGWILLCILAIQSSLLALWLFWRARADFLKLWQQRETAIVAGVAGGIASIGWYGAAALQSVAYVKTVGQIEFVLTLMVTYVYFKEVPTRYELFGMSMIVLGIFLLLWAEIF